MGTTYGEETVAMIFCHLHAGICPSHNVPTTDSPLLALTQSCCPQPQLVYSDIRLRKLPLHTTAPKHLHHTAIALYYAALQDHPTGRTSSVVRAVAGLALL